MPESLRRVNPVLPDSLDTRVWEGNNQGGSKRQRGDRKAPDSPPEDAIDEIDSVPGPPSLIDVRI